MHGRITTVLMAFLLVGGTTVHLLGSKPVEISAASTAVAAEPSTSVAPADPNLVLPIADYANRRTLKRFGTWVDDGRFLGYHLGEDVEYGDVAEEVVVHAIADGTVLVSGWVNGYGGTLIIQHEIDGEKINAIYGHLDPASLVKEGESVAKGQTIARLGDGFTDETDGRRKHLHFGLYAAGEDLRVNGYTLEAMDLKDWIDPQELFKKHGRLS
jgi:murein DD-endopeptidase MepM/ murein hydrolase activator NlpD